MDEGKPPGVHDEEDRLCAVCGTEGRYFRVRAPLELAVREDCFDGRKTRVDLEDEYLGGYVDRYKETEEEVWRG